MAKERDAAKKLAAAAGSSDSVVGAVDRDEIEAEIEQRYEAKLKAALEAARKNNSDGGVPVEQVEKVTSQYKTLVAELKKKLEKTLQDLQRKDNLMRSATQKIMGLSEENSR